LRVELHDTLLQGIQGLIWKFQATDRIFRKTCLELMSNRWIAPKAARGERTSEGFAPGAGRLKVWRGSRAEGGPWGRSKTVNSG